MMVPSCLSCPGLDLYRLVLLFFLLRAEHLFHKCDTAQVL